ncbi:hypothetical protein ABZ541_13215 [Micromonospora sediminicola]|uniref:hypothetical protein n=1 Tax=Micromonospora sediminicola TaxID=946078 RepID=UPI0033D8D598
MPAPIRGGTVDRMSVWSTTGMADGRDGLPARLAVAALMPRELLLALSGRGRVVETAGTWPVAGAAGGGRTRR